MPTLHVTILVLVLIAPLHIAMLGLALSLTGRRAMIVGKGKRRHDDGGSGQQRDEPCRRFGGHEQILPCG
ncbi:MAG: hypothetical protein WAW54_17075 [Parvibaculum sedimenti]|uniref:hypothetical protein n=1 Tax=Parvibaculum sedimenti TaxID=2608632 RepID=UPI003BB760B4